MKKHAEMFRDLSKNLRQKWEHELHAQEKTLKKKSKKMDAQAKSELSQSVAAAGAAPGSAQPDRGGPHPEFQRYVAGTSQLEDVLTALCPDVHIFGHSHRDMDVVLEGT
eukprot:CAMPEP_0177684160 /NCGR_PEP_ID=MMETSP0447-20121125/32260_1 /TAXON_ID=0 /ORGANISM="Stygamoeba regulata, Strain BSH-02190019" /LENGTH=108 /DNA_ID=CAMNT_0019193943 /DNA_START=132 /DNA_END=453 /DNA_ORIENTATION=+